MARRNTCSATEGGVRQEDGSIVVVDEQSHEIRRFDAGGRYVDRPHHAHRAVGGTGPRGHLRAPGPAPELLSGSVRHPCGAAPLRAGALARDSERLAGALPRLRIG